MFKLQLNFEILATVLVVSFLLFHFETNLYSLAVPK